MIERLTIARPYAKAIFEVAEKNKSYQSWSQALLLLSWIVVDNRVVHLLHNQTVSVSLIADFFLEIGGQQLQKEEQNFVRVLACARRLSLIPYIIELYEQLRADLEGTLVVKLISAAPLDARQKDHFSKKLGKFFDRTIQLDCHVEGSLIGGYVVRAGDRVIDNSLKGELSRIKEVMGG